MILVGDAGIGRISMIEKIVNKKADYIFPIKSNSRKYFEEVKAMFTSRLTTISNSIFSERLYLSFIILDTVEGLISRSRANARSIENAGSFYYACIRTVSVLFLLANTLIVMNVTC